MRQPIHSLSNQSPVESSAQRLEVLKNQFGTPQFALRDAHEMVQLAAELGVSLTLAEWLVPRRQASNLGIIALVSTALDIDRNGLVQQCVDEAVESLPAYTDLLRQFGDFLVEEGFTRKATKLFEVLAPFFKDNLSFHHNWRKAAYRSGSHRIHQYVCKIASERFPHESEFALEEIRARAYDPSYTQRELNIAARNWADGHFEDRSPTAGKASGSRIPKVGLLGRHLHPMFLAPLLNSVDQKRLNLEVITNDPRATALWSGPTRSIPESSTEEAVAAIRSQGYDVVIKMTAQHPDLEVLAARVAPLQGSWICTNLSQGPQILDFILADTSLVPQSGRQDWSEEIIDLPIWAPFQFFSDLPEIEICPYETNGYITFGSCQRAMKFNVTTLALWAKILSSVPKSRLIIKDKCFTDPMARNAFMARCQYAGLNPESLSFESGEPHPDYFNYYGRIDISLDTFPYGGGILTAEALWMGVPVITLSGMNYDSRLALNYLKAIQRHDWSAATSGDYVARAVDLANNRQELKHFRQTARQEMASSAIMDYDAFARGFETNILELIRRSQIAN